MAQRLGIGDALAGDVVGGVLRRRVTGMGSPPSSVTPREKPSSLIAIWPWSWYMVTTESKTPSRARSQTVSEGNGPLASIPSLRASATAGAMTSISSRPKAPPSPACGFRAATAMRGGENPARRICASASPIASSTRTRVRWAHTCESAMCEVTRAFHRRPRMLNSPTGFFHPR